MTEADIQSDCARRDRLTRFQIWSTMQHQPISDTRLTEMDARAIDAVKVINELLDYRKSPKIQALFDDHWNLINEVRRLKEILSVIAPGWNIIEKLSGNLDSIAGVSSESAKCA